MQKIHILRVVGKSIKISKPKKNSGSTNLSITGRQSNVLRRTGSLQRVRIKGAASSEIKGAAEDIKDAAEAAEEDEGCEETYAEHGTYSSAQETRNSPLLSQKFETEPTKYFEDKIFSALFDKLLIRYATLLCILCIIFIIVLIISEKNVSVCLELWSRPLRVMRPR